RFARYADNARRDSEKVTEFAQGFRKEILDELTGPLPTDRFDEFFNGVRARAAEAAEQMVKVKRAAGGVAQAFRGEAGFARAGEIFKEVRTPLDQFQEKVTELNKLTMDGALGWDTYARAVGRAVDELERANNQNETKRAEAVQQGTQAAQAAINSYQARIDVERRREDPAQ